MFSLNSKTQSESLLIFKISSYLNKLGVFDGISYPGLTPLKGKNI
jgi:hypothetical protein